MKRIAVLTSGGDCSGMNAVIRGVVRTALANDMEVIGIMKGYAGLIEGLHEPLTTRSVSGILQRGGTFLQSARCPAMLTPEGQQQALSTVRRLKVEGLVIIGGDGSLRGARVLHQLGVQTVGIPASIDNDIPCTDMSLGVDTALNNIRYAVDCLKDTASSHDRTFVVETMGRNCGYLAVAAAISCGAEFALIPEQPYAIDEICRKLNQRFKEGRDNSLILVSEGVASAREIADQLKDCVGFETRIMVLGHYQRGGSPTTFDRLLAARFGVAAVEALIQGGSGVMLALSCTQLVRVDLNKVLDSGLKPIDQSLLDLLSPLGN
ncbi:MAG: 6-phosphofructokinase [Desulfuromonadales bacterium]|nr:6-phosphofructokinase [Desulfuromonadales bacterium]